MLVVGIVPMYQPVYEVPHLLAFVADLGISVPPIPIKRTHVEKVVEKIVWSHVLPPAGETCRVASLYTV